MSLATLFAWRALASDGLQLWIGRLFLANAVLGIPVLLTYFVNPAFFGVAALWGITVPGSTVLLALFFRRERKRLLLASPRQHDGRGADSRPAFIVEEVT